MGYAFTAILQGGELNISVWKDGKFLAERNCDWRKKAVDTAVEKLAKRYGLDQDDLANHLQAQLSDSPPY